MSSYYTDEFNALNSLIGALGSDTLSAGNSYERDKIYLLQKLASIFKLEAIATGQSIKADSLGNFVPANFADSVHSHAHLDSLVGQKPAKTFLAAPSDTLGEPTYRQITVTDIPTELSSLAGGSFSPQNHSHGALDTLTASQAAKSFLASPTNSTGPATYRTIGMADLPSQLSSLSGGTYAPQSHTHSIEDLPDAVETAIAASTAKRFWATPIAEDGTPSFRAIAKADLPATTPHLDTSNTFGKAQRSQMKPLSIADDGTVTLTPADSNDFVLELSQNATLVIQPGTASDSFRLTIVQTAIGGRVLSLPTGTLKQGGKPLIFSASPGAIDQLFFNTHNGTTWCVSCSNFS